MRKNIGTSDRLWRLLIAVVLLSLAIWKGSWILGGIGLFTLYEAIAGWCIMYQFLGKNSCDVK